ncbi:MAG: hypothetical protein JF609_09170 [Verrucomicrobia bacterium]|nr:hypothetical protein [Verrucomicrobiota bacterium]
MPIRINLLAESLAEEDLRRRDPVKRAIIAGSLLVAISLVWFSSSWLESLMANNRLAAIDGEIQSHTNDYSQVLVNQKKIAEAQRRLEALQKLNMTRFLQGNLMEAFQKIYVPNVQLMRVRLDQTYATSAGTPAVTNAYGVVAGKPGLATEKILLTVDAKDLSVSAGDQVNHFKDALVSQDFFKSQINATNGVHLSNLSSPQTGVDNRSFVMFTLECRFPDKIR